MDRTTRELLVPVLLLALLFGVQSSLILSEYALTLLATCMSAVVFFMWYNEKEWLMFAIGFTIFGIGGEVGLRNIGNQQFWADASLFGVPYWLPIAWGMFFVLIPRIDRYVR